VTEHGIVISDARVPGRETQRADDVFFLFDAFLTKAKTAWMHHTYEFAGFGQKVSIHHSCDIRKSASHRIKVGNGVYVARDTWLNVPNPNLDMLPSIILGDGCQIGRRCMISAKNKVWLEADVLLGPSVLITDHSHEFSDPNRPIHAQGLTAGGTVHIEPNCWLGHGAVVLCNSGDLVLGRNSVVGANSVVTRSVPAFSVVVGNPARVVKQYDEKTGKWVKAIS